MSEHTPLIEAERAAELSMHIRNYLTEYTDISTPGLHATALTHVLLAARTSTATADTEGCWQPCDPDCEVGPVHCEAVHLPSHKAKTVLHTAECVATADTGLRERVEALADQWDESSASGHPDCDIDADCVACAAAELRAARDATTDTEDSR